MTAFIKISLIVDHPRMRSPFKNYGEAIGGKTSQQQENH